MSGKQGRNSRKIIRHCYRIRNLKEKLQDYRKLVKKLTVKKSKYSFNDIQRIVVQNLISVK